MDWRHAALTDVASQGYDEWAWMNGKFPHVGGVRHKLGYTSSVGWEVCHTESEGGWIAALNVTSLEEGKKLVEVLNRMGG